MTTRTRLFVYVSGIVCLTLLSACASASSPSAATPFPIASSRSTVTPASTPSATPGLTHTSIAIATRAPIVQTAASTPAHDATLFGSLINPLVKLANDRRAQREKSDDNWSRRVDKELNRERINLVVYISGENYEPPRTRNKAISYFILSYNLRTSKYDKITISRDFASPEVAREITGDPSRVTPTTRIGEAFYVGGFDFSRVVLENATGLSADFVLVISDTFISNLIDAIGGVDINIPNDIRLYEFYVEGERFAARDFEAGRLHMDGLTALGYAKAMPKGDYSPTTERVLRSQSVFDAILTKLNQSLTPIEAITLSPKLIAFVNNEENLAGMDADFDLKNLVNTSINDVVGNLVQVLFKYGANLGTPKPGRGIYVAAEFQGGGGGIRTVQGDMLIPLNADPNGDLVDDYWKSVRDFIRSELARGD